MIVKRILIIIAYDGTNYQGFAAQKDPAILTIEGILNQRISDLTGEETHVIGASRTDSGVHARCNYAVFDTHSPIPPEKFALALNTRLPEDIRVRKSYEVDREFNPHSMTTEKTYEYRIYNARIEDPTLTRYMAYTWFRLDPVRMQEGADYLIGEHDFKSFANVATTAATTVRTIVDIRVTREELSFPDIMRGPHGGAAEQDKAYVVTIRVTGRGFLYNMVRIIAGTLMEVGRGQIPPERVGEMLAACDRQVAGPTAPAKGLTLVNYRIVNSC